MNHVILGASVPFALCVLWYAWRRGRASLWLLILGPLAMGLSGAWAVVPDMPRAAHDLERYVALHHHPRCNVFWFHCWIDKDESDWPGFPVVFVLMAAAVMIAAWRELARAERVGAGMSVEKR
jgi:hypothetical protein